MSYTFNVDTYNSIFKAMTLVRNRFDPLIINCVINFFSVRRIYSSDGNAPAEFSFHNLLEKNMPVSSCEMQLARELFITIVTKTKI